jgi:hypothetical protein
MMKRILLLIMFYNAALYVFSERIVYVYKTEDRVYGFEYYFEDGEAYLEIPYGWFYDYLEDTSTPVFSPGRGELRVIDGYYSRDSYRGFTIITLKGRKYLFLESEDMAASVVIPVLNAPDDRWYTFWGIRKSFFDKRIIMSDGIVTKKGATLSETINGELRNYDRMAGSDFIDRTSFWVEGVDGYGIGESFTVSRDPGMTGMVFMNGFIAPWNLDLYYHNSRVKQIKLEYDDTSEIVDLKDMPAPQIIYFKKALMGNKVKITILDIYPGEKYQDTAITTILFLNPTWKGWGM